MMVAQIILLADVRPARARVTVQVSADPLGDELLAAFWAWYSYWTGDKPKARPVAVVRKIGGR